MTAVGALAATSAAAWWYGGAAVLLAAAWVAVHRLSWRTSPRTRQRIRLAVSSATGIPGRYVSPVVGTAVYLACGLVAAGALLALSDLSLSDLLAGDVTARGAAVTLLAVIGSHALTGCAMSVVHAVRPALDIAAAVTDVPWVREVSALGRHWRWAVPMVSAAVEEFFFRGVVLLGLLAAGAPAWGALVVSGLVFAAGQLLMTTNRVQALVMGVSSVVLSLVGGLLVLAGAGVLSAVLVHASFAGYYTRTSFDRGGRAHV